jgi:hypothetical protein
MIHVHDEFNRARAQNASHNKRSLCRYIRSDDCGDTLISGETHTALFRPEALGCKYTETPKYINLVWDDGPASWSRGQSFWLLIRRSRVLLWGFFFEGEDTHGDPGLGSLVELGLRSLLVLHIHISTSTSSGQRNCASWASQPQKSVTLRPQPGGETTKSIRDML